MTLRISGKNLAIGEALRMHVQARIDGVTAKYHAGSPTGHVTIGPEGSGYRSDCTLFLASGITLQVEAVAHEPYVSFDKAADRIERRLRRHKKRQVSHHGNGGAQGLRGEELDVDPTPMSIELPDDMVEETFPAVVAEPVDTFAEMTVAAAVRELDDPDRAVVIFRYSENRRINIVYRRSDGNIGWVDPFRSTNGRAS